MITAYKFKLSRQGFTLIELMIAVAILAILAVIGLTLFGNVQQAGRDARRKADIQAIAKTLEVQKSQANTTTYPAMTNAMFAGGAIPSDPINSGAEVYTLPAGLPAATWFTCALLESGKGGNSTSGTTNTPTNTPLVDGKGFCLTNQQ